MPKKKKQPIEVESHGNGFMILGVTTPHDAAVVLTDYVDNIQAYVFACPTHYQGRCSVWLSMYPLAVWEGAREPHGPLLPR